MKLRYNQKPKTSIVRMFPRLVPARVISTQVRVEQPATRDRLARVATTNLPNDRTQVRARLLHMILDNERSRRHAPRPNAS